MKLYLFAYLFLYLSLQAQTVTVKGKIVNEQSGKPLPYVNIGVQGTHFGTTSNTKGKFRLSLKQGTFNLIVSCVGFETETIRVNASGQKEIQVKLRPISIELPEVIVNAKENPAYAIIRKAIANKEKNKSGLKNYFYNFYSKNIMKSGKEISFIEEDVGDGFNDLTGKITELKSKFYKTENLSNKVTQKLFTKTDMNFLEKKVIDFTDDSLRLGKFVFHLPLSHHAFDYYDYKLNGIQQSGNRVFYNIEVIPLSKIRPTFKGSILIDDSSYALTGLNLTLQNRNLMPFTEFKMAIVQNLANIQKYWLPKYYNIDVEFNFNYSYLFGIDSLITSFVKIFNNHVINISKNNPLLVNINKSEDTTLNISAEIITSKQMDSLRLYPLSLGEIEAYKNIDSTKSIAASFKLTGVIGKYAKSKNLVTSDLDDKDKQRKNNNNGFTFGKIFKYINFQNNRVDGITLGLKHSGWISNKIFNYSLNAGYAFARKDVNANLSFYIPVKNSFIDGLEISGNYGSKPFYVFTPYPLFFNSVAVTLGFEDQFNYFNSKSGSVKFEKNLGKNTSLKLGAIFECQKSLKAKKYYSIFNSKRAVRNNPAIKEGTDNRIVLNFKSGKTPYKLNFMTANGFTSQIEVSSKVIGSRFNYTRINAAYQFYIKTMYSELFFSPYLAVFIETSAVLGNYDIHRLYTPQTALGFYSPFGTFKALRPYELAGDKSIAVHLEHNWRKTFFDMLGIYFPVAWNIELTTGANFLALHNKIENFNPDKNTFYWEVYAGISGILGIINVNVVYNKYKRTVVRLGLSKFF